ncbi:DUF808 domain-containing protein [Cardiobacteriaceae bacterium TAE3-ERU3]|nr:DUF808 domain-containing protein [Cardiobacteriaceae bacterium TAE3-ERU3]
MAASFFALFDDIAALLDDVALLTKAATKKTAGVLGDDLALNANQLTGISAKRELPVVWAVAKGSIVNKVILVPIALLLSFFVPWVVPYLLMVGGAYLCYEGIEKVMHILFHRQQEIERRALRVAANAQAINFVEFERAKIRGAIRTDFILSAEIIVIALGEILKYDMSLTMNIIALSIIALLITFLVYGVVAMIVKMDDVGKYWVENRVGLMHKVGRGLLWFAPRMLKALSVIGTIAMFIVGGHIWVEGVPAIHHTIAHWLETIQIGLSWLLTALADIAVGILVGLAVYALVAPLTALWGKLRGKPAKKQHA